MKVAIVSLTAEEQENIVCTAFEGGISYWCVSAEAMHENKGGDGYCPEGWAWSLFLTDECADDDVTVQTLDAESLLKGIQICLEKYPWHVNLDGDFDAGDADAIVQCAVLGDVIYG
jgi:hypothetical protein